MSPPLGIHALGLFPTAEVFWLPDQRLPQLPCLAAVGLWGSLLGDSGGTAPDSHRTSFTAVVT